MDSHTGQTNPVWVNSLLNWEWTLPLTRIGLASAYVVGGISKLLDFPGAVAEQSHFGVNPPGLFAVLTIVVELLGSALLISGRWLWLGAGALAVFTGLATLIAHHFWTMVGQERFLATNAFFEHLGLIAGFVLAAMLAGRQRRQGQAP